MQVHSVHESAPRLFYETSMFVRWPTPQEDRLQNTLAIAPMAGPP